jgi:hypothetical protein
VEHEEAVDVPDERPVVEVARQEIRVSRIRTTSTRFPATIRYRGRTCSRAASSATARSWSRRLYKQPFALASGACLEDPEVRVRVFAARVEQETVSVHAAP